MYINTDSLSVPAAAAALNVSKSSLYRALAAAKKRRSPHG